jgi:ubiquinone/menaquinone biosynthesis C-methylase UbiE
MILLPSLAIVRKEFKHAVGYQQLALETENVMRFYDELGWHSTKDGMFEDGARFEDLRPVSREYIRGCHLRVGKQIRRHGKYLLDVASGPVQHSEYRAYSDGYDRRICVDISIVALRAAKERLGDKGIYIQGDITHLPLKDASVDAFVSLHTIYHVPQENQATAFKELERVLANEGTGVVVYSWGSHCLPMALLTARPSYAALKRLLTAVSPTFLLNLRKKVFQAQTPASPGTGIKELELYFRPHGYTWFQREIAAKADWNIRVWRSVSVPFLRRYVHDKLLGRSMLAVLSRLEDAAPHLFGKFGQYPMMVCRKSGTSRDLPF